MVRSQKNRDPEQDQMRHYNPHPDGDVTRVIGVIELGEEREQVGLGERNEESSEVDRQSDERQINAPAQGHRAGRQESALLLFQGGLSGWVICVDPRVSDARARHTSIGDVGGRHHVQYHGQKCEPNG